MNEGWIPPGTASAPSTAPPERPASSIKSSSAEDVLLPFSRPLQSDPRPLYASFFLSQFDARKYPPEALVIVNSSQRYFGLLLGPSPFGDGSNPLPYAAEALAMNHFGKLNAAPRLIRESIAPYVKALQSMSSRLAHIQHAGIDCIDEEEVMQLMFSCLYLAFWELLESVSSKHSTFLSEQKWHRFRALHPSLPPETSWSNSDPPMGPKHYLDFILDHLITISNLTAEFSDGLTKSPNLFSLQRMKKQGETVLRRLEPVLGYMMANIGGDIGQRQGASEAPARGPLWGRPLEYNLASLCRTAAVTLRLLIYDVIREQQQLVNPPGLLLIKPQGQADSNGHASCHGLELAEHRAALMAHVEAIVNMIPYSSHGNIFGVAPLCFVPAFRIAKVVLSRERTALCAEGERQDEVEKCLATECVIQQHLNFVASKKIPVKIDV
ncbi:hypothetical protein B0T14DRAFT_554362 [Immersiella caudata]|uniref:Uncharacterized protein n=1 Tax=Immersiella caudata TaxID=314043 RepID=A0AA39WP73_9PEZI|nr:hypothetical protein B0T14DRAFT_554362 [Immersiella caudata]